MLKCVKLVSGRYVPNHARQLSNFANDNAKHIEFISQNTEISTEHLTPEIKLHLITPNCPLYKGREEDCPVEDPFWAFYWPGGQALTRYILDQPSVVKDKRVLDVGSGCGATAIAAKMCGAKSVIANDISHIALVATAMNASLNNAHFQMTPKDLIGLDIPDVDIVLLGDMFYDTEFATTIASWLSRLQSKGIAVAVGDPGRLSFMMHPIKRKLELLASYDLPKTAREENNGLYSGYVWGSKSRLKS